MKTTISHIKADIGSLPGHTTVYQPPIIITSFEVFNLSRIFMAPSRDDNPYTYSLPFINE